MLKSILVVQSSFFNGIFTPQFFLMSGILVVFYFFMLRPQQKQQKEQKDFIEGLKKGSQVVTIGGICGRVYSVSGDTITLEIDSKGTKMVVLKGAVSLDSTKQFLSK